MRRGLIGLVVSGALVGAAHADPPRIRLRAPAGCSSSQELRERIADEERCDPAAGTVIDVTIGRDGDAWRVRVATAGGERTLTGASCEEVAAAAALVAALGMTCAPEHPPDPPRPWRAGAGVVVDGAMAPAWSPGLDVGGAHIDGPVELRLDAILVAPHASPSSSVIFFEGVGASACFFIACAGLTAGVVGGHATDTRVAFGMAATAGLAYRVPIGPVDVRASFEYALDFTRPRFVVASMVAYQPPIWGAMALFSVEARFR